MTTIKPAPIKRSITVNAPQQKAFDVFVKDFGKWWPSHYKIGKSDYKTAILEPRVGGRWYEIGTDGETCSWGEVIAWNPPASLVLAWRISTDWQFDPALLTEVEVRFVPVSANETRVELEHRLLENLGEKAAAHAEVFGSEHGWPGILRSFAAAVQG